MIRINEDLSGTEYLAKMNSTKYEDLDFTDEKYLVLPEMVLDKYGLAVDESKLDSDLFVVDENLNLVAALDFSSRTAPSSKDDFIIKYGSLPEELIEPLIVYLNFVIDRPRNKVVWDFFRMSRGNQCP